jgi:hypothetical protein
MHSDRTAALLLIHGMGEQRSYQLTDDFVRNLAKLYGTSPGNVSLTHHLLPDTSQSGARVRSHVSLNIRESNGPNGFRQLDVHEVYWADRPKGLIKLRGTLTWLAKTAMVPVKAWAQHAALLTSNPDLSRWKRAGLLVREILLAALLPLFGLTLLALGVWVPGRVKYFWNAIRQNLTTVNPSIWSYVWLILLAAIALVLVASIWGAWGIGSLVRHERKITANKEHYEERWRRLGVWMMQSIAAGVLVIPLAVLVAMNDSLRETLGAITNVGDWGDFFTLAGILAGIGVAWKLSTFVVGWFGDVAVYFDGADQLSPYRTVRESILEISSRRLRELLQRGQYDDVYVAAHSLGSVIAYDTINLIAAEQRASSESGPKGPVSGGSDSGVEFHRLRGLLSFGSPLDKVAYFFHQSVKPERRVRAQILSSHSSFRRRRSGRPYGPFRFTTYRPAVPERFHWVNVWSPFDPLGHHLDYYLVEDQPKTRFRPWAGHTQFWKNPAFYREVARWLESPSMTADIAEGGGDIRATLAGFDPESTVFVEIARAGSDIGKATELDPLLPEPISTTTDLHGGATLSFPWVWTAPGTYAVRAFQERGPNDWISSNAVWKTEK